MGDRYSGRSPVRRGPPTRDRPPPRDRDDHPNVEYFGAGESYRPGGPTGEGPYRPARERDNDRWNPPDRREDRRDDRRDERRRDDIDSYIPPTSSRAQRNRSRSPPPYRRRSRSPPPAAPRGRTELFPDRPARSPPPPRRYSPPRNDRPRSPVRRRSRSPYASRGRTPDSKRGRDFSPDGRRSPKRERLDSPPRSRYNDRPRSPPRRPPTPERNTYRPRSRSPPRRDDGRPPYADERWRRLSPSPRASTNTSRRSSPPIHPDRASPAGSRPQSPSRDRRRYDERRDDSYTSAGRPRSPPPRRDEYGDRERDKSREQTPRDRDEYGSTAGPPTGPRGAGYNRPPPSGPARAYSTQEPSPPPSAAGTSASASMSAQNRPGTFAPPSGPRGAVPARDFASPPGAIRGRTSLTYRAPGYRPPLPNSSSFDAPVPPITPSGPRATSYSGRGDFTSPTGGRGSYPTGPSRPSPTSTGSEFPFRPSLNSSTSTTYPRSQRFNTTTTTTSSNPPTGPSSLTTTFTNPASATHTPSPITPATPATFVKSQLATLERPIPGGRHIPGSSHSSTGYTADQEKKMRSLEEDADRIRGDISDKQRAKREVLREWEIRERESEIAGLRSELADAHLRALGEEEAVLVSAAF